jgi:hypothetical protein
MEAVVTYYEVLSRHLPGGSEENHENPESIGWYPGRDLNSGPPEYEARMLTSISRMRKVEDEKCI